MYIMSFQVISPVFMQVDGSNFNEAIKNFTKLHHNLAINQLILNDQLSNLNMYANIRYYNLNGRSKASISMVPTTASTIVAAQSLLPPTINGFTSTLPSTSTANASILPIHPAGIVNPMGAIANIKPVYPIGTDGKPITMPAYLSLNTPLLI